MPCLIGSVGCETGWLSHDDNVVAITSIDCRPGTQQLRDCSINVMTIQRTSEIFKYYYYISCSTGDLHVANCDFLTMALLTFPVDCGTPEGQGDGLSVEYNGTSLGSVATYSCSAGYTMTGREHMRKCLANSTWSGTAPHCLGNKKFLANVII